MFETDAGHAIMAVDIMSEMEHRPVVSSISLSDDADMLRGWWMRRRLTRQA
jgi:hypothetical protein